MMVHHWHMHRQFFYFVVLDNYSIVQHVHPGLARGSKYWGVVAIFWGGCSGFFLMGVKSFF
jgi:hypothetical protein